MPLIINRFHNYKVVRLKLDFHKSDSLCKISTVLRDLANLLHGINAPIPYCTRLSLSPLRTAVTGSASVKVS